MLPFIGLISADCSLVEDAVELAKSGTKILSVIVDPSLSRTLSPIINLPTFLLNPSPTDNTQSKPTPSAALVGITISSPGWKEP